MNAPKSVRIPLLKLFERHRDRAEAPNFNDGGFCRAPRASHQNRQRNERKTKIQRNNSDQFVDHFFQRIRVRFRQNSIRQIGVENVSDHFSLFIISTKSRAYKFISYYAGRLCDIIEVQSSK